MFFLLNIKFATPRKSSNQPNLTIFSFFLSFFLQLPDLLADSHAYFAPQDPL